MQFRRFVAHLLRIELDLSICASKNVSKLPEDDAADGAKKSSFVKEGKHTSARNFAAEGDIGEQV